MRLSRPLWTETPAFRRHRLLRFALLAPVAGLAGALWGGAAGGAVAAVAGAGVFTAGAWLHSRLHPAVLQWAQRRWGLGRAAAFLWDVVVVGGGGLLVTRGLGLEWPPAVGSALALGGGVALALGWLMGEGGTATLHALVSPLGRHGRPRVAWSHIEAKLVRNQFQEARAALEVVVEEHPEEARGWILLGEVLAGPLGDEEEGLRAWEDGLRAVRGTPAREREVVARMVSFQERRDPHGAAALLRRHARSWEPGPEADWAHRTLRRLTSGRPDEGVAP